MIQEHSSSPAQVPAPPGAWLKEGQTLTIGASTRSKSAPILLAFAAIWSAAFLGGLYGSQIFGKFDLVTSLFGLPFLAASIALCSFAVYSMWGKVEVRIIGSTGEAFVGVGAVGWKRAFDAAQVRTITEDWAGWSRGKQPRRAIVIDAAERLKFGSLLSEPRRMFVLESLRRALNLP